MDFIPDSDDECPIARPNRNLQSVNDRGNDIETIYSDEDDEVWNFASLPVPIQPTPQNQPQSGILETHSLPNRRHTLTGAIKPRPQYQRRRLVSSAVVAQAASAATSEAEAQPMDDLLGSGSLIQACGAPKPAAPRFFARTAPAFVGRPPPQPLKPLPEPKPAQPAATEPTKHSPQDISGQPMERSAASGEIRPPAGRPTSAKSLPATSQPAPFSLPSRAPETTGPTIHTREDGLSVIFNKRKRSVEETEGAGSSKRSVNTGWGNNFVRNDIKVR